MRRLAWAALCAAGVLGWGGSAGAAVVYSESGTLHVGCAPVHCTEDTFQIGSIGLAPFPQDAQGAGAYHYELTFSDPSVILTIRSQITDYSGFDRFVDGSFDIGGDGFGFGTLDPSFHATPTGFAGDFVVPPTSDVTVFVDGHARRTRTVYRKGIYIDGLFSIPAPEYTFTISSVPEPATWALMLAGFLGLGAALRRQRIVGA